MAEYSSGAGTLLVARWSVEERIVVEMRAQSRRRHGSVAIGGAAQDQPAATHIFKKRSPLCTSLNRAHPFDHAIDSIFQLPHALPCAVPARELQG
jgi:hypothetical protein